MPKSVWTCLPMAGCSPESAVCACTSPVLPPSSSTTTTTRKSTAPGSPNALKAADPAGTAPQPRSNAGASRKSANGNPATNRGAGGPSARSLADAAKRFGTGAHIAGRNGMPVRRRAARCGAGQPRGGEGLTRSRRAVEADLDRAAVGSPAVGRDLIYLAAATGLLDFACERDGANGDARRTCEDYPKPGSSAMSAPDRPAVLDDRTAPAVFAATLQASAFGRMDAQTAICPELGSPRWPILRYLAWVRTNLYGTKSTGGTCAGRSWPWRAAVRLHPL